MAHARSMPARSSGPGRRNAHKRKLTLSNPGANAATANFFFALRAAMPSAAVPMKKMYGKTMRVSETVRWNSPSRWW